MAFTLHSATGSEDFSDDDSWTIDRHGCLTVKLGGGDNARHRLYSPSGWTYLEYPEDVMKVPVIAGMQPG